MTVTCSRTNKCGGGGASGSGDDDEKKEIDVSDRDIDGKRYDKLKDMGQCVFHW
jgi:hypothetical protein